MVTKATIDKLTKAIEQIAVADVPAITVAVFSGETPALAVQRHIEHRPEHAGRRVHLNWRTEPRDHVNEMFAVCSQAEVTAAVEAIWAQNEGIPLGVQMQRDVARSRAICLTERGTTC